MLRCQILAAFIEYKHFGGHNVKCGGVVVRRMQIDPNQPEKSGSKAFVVCRMLSKPHCLL